MLMLSDGYMEAHYVLQLVHTLGLNRIQNTNSIYYMKLEGHEVIQFRVLSRNYIQTAILYPTKTFNHQGNQKKDTFRKCLKN